MEYRYRTRSGGFRALSRPVGAQTSSNAANTPIADPRVDRDEVLVDVASTAATHRVQPTSYDSKGRC